MHDIDEIDAIALRVISKGGRLGASALDIGRNVALEMEASRRRTLGIEGREMLGFALGAKLVARGVVALTRGNRFVLPGMLQR